MSAHQGVGLWLWQLSKIAGGDPQHTAALCDQLHARRAYIKVADGRTRSTSGRAVTGKALHDAGIAPWAWSYCYDSSPKEQADALADAAKEYGCKGAIVNAEIEFNDRKGPDASTMDALLSRLRERLGPTFPIGLSSFKFPTFQPSYPWHVLHRHNVLGMPQVYLWGRRGARHQTTRAILEWSALGLQVLPSLGAWDAAPDGHTPGQVLEAGEVIKGLAQVGLCHPVADLWVLDRMEAREWEWPCTQLTDQLREHGPLSAALGLETPWWQLAALLRLGFYDGPLNTGWTADARGCLQKVQAELGTKPDGVWGPRTQAAVRGELTRRGLP